LIEDLKMAKIYEEVVIIKLSKLTKDGQDAIQGTLASADVLGALEQVAQELVGEGIIVEVISN
jgi:hypothetical protein